MSKLPKGPYTYVPGNQDTFPCVQFPPRLGLSRRREICINEPPGSTWAELEALAQFIAESPAVLRQLIDALEEAHDGLKWYRGRYPEAVDGSDDETTQRIEAAIAAGENLR